MAFSFAQKTWAAGNDVTSTELNRIEQGIVDASTVGGASGFLILSRSGMLAVQAGTAQIPIPTAITIDSVTTRVGTAPAGAAILVDVNKNGATIFTTQANRPSIASGGNQSSAAVPNTTAVAGGDYLTVDVDQVGSTANSPGFDLTVVIKYH